MQVTDWLDVHQSAEKEEFEAKQKELEGVVLPILQSLSGGAPGGMPDFGAGAAPSTSSGPAAAAEDGPKIEVIPED